MRIEIEEKIRNSGTTDETLIIEGYKRALRNSGTPEQVIEGLAQNKESIQILKHQINLDGLNINDEEIEEIAQMIVDKKPHTRRLSLHGNHITDKGISKLARLFISLENLSSLNLQGNQIGEEGLHAIYELAAYKPNLDLALGGNKISEVGTIERIKWEEKSKALGKKGSTP